MSSRVEQLKALVTEMTVEEILEVNKWIFEKFNSSDNSRTWEEAIEDAGSALKCLARKPN